MILSFGFIYLTDQAAMHWNLSQTTSSLSTQGTSLLHNRVLNLWVSVGWKSMDLQKSLFLNLHILLLSDMLHLSQLLHPLLPPLWLLSAAALSGHGKLAHLSRLTQKRGDDTLWFTLTLLPHASLLFHSSASAHTRPLHAKSLSMFPLAVKRQNQEQEAKLWINRRWSCLRESKSSFY